MNTVLELIREGGPVMVPLGLVSILLYERCFNLLLLLVQWRRHWLKETGTAPGGLANLRARQDQLREVYLQHRLAIGGLVAAAPLLGLLGTVMGMVDLFASIGGTAGQARLEGLAGGISMALITTEAGLCIAIPAVVLLYHAQRQVQRGIQVLSERERRLLEGA